MSQPASVRVSVHVDVDVATAFEVFTGEIDAWYRRGPHTTRHPERLVAIRLEPGVGGRLLEVYDNDSGETRTQATVTTWDPPHQLVLRDTLDTEIDVTFESSDDGTKVTLEHRGLERLRPRVAETKARFGGRLLIAWFSDHMRERTRP